MIPMVVERTLVSLLLFYALVSLLLFYARKAITLHWKKKRSPIFFFLETSKYQFTTLEGYWYKLWLP